MAEHIAPALIEASRQKALAEHVRRALWIVGLGDSEPVVGVSDCGDSTGMTISAKNHTIGMSSFIGDILGAGVDARLIALKLRDLSNITLDREIYGLIPTQWVECLNYCIDSIRNPGK